MLSLLVHEAAAESTDGEWDSTSYASNTQSFTSSYSSSSLEALGHLPLLGGSAGASAGDGLSHVSGIGCSFDCPLSKLIDLIHSPSLNKYLPAQCLLQVRHMIK